MTLTDNTITRQARMMEGEGHHPEARRALRAAWKLKPGSIKPLGFILASFLGWTPTADVPP